jgi:HSP20 family molecular chaperone IbpA
MSNRKDLATTSAASCCAPATVAQTARQVQEPERPEWSYTPAMDVMETANEYVIQCDAPGVQSDAINLTYESGVLHVHGRVPTRGPSSGQYLRQEYGVGDFDRQIPLGRLAEFVDGERLSAEYALGVLTIHLPKLEFAQPRRIQVKVAGTH